MIDAKLEIDGLDGVLDALDDASGAELLDDVADALGRAANTVAADTAADTPVATGRARRGVTAEPGRVEGNTATAAITSTGVPSAHFAANEEAILSHDAEHEAVKETGDAIQRAFRKHFRS